VVPTDLGVTLVQGYHAIDPELALPTIRMHVEKQLDLIAEGKADHAAVVSHTLRQFTEKYKNFTAQIERMDNLFEASFNPTTSSSKPFSKCGQCLRYLRLVTSRPPRLYCPTQEQVLDLPQGGVVKLYNNRCCPLCDYELLLYTAGDRTYPLCPYCFNHPPFPDAPGLAPGPRGILSGCPHPRVHPVVRASGTKSRGLCLTVKGL
jgi:DNA topoisomerase-3